MSDTLVIVLLWVLFGGSHILLAAEGVKRALIRRLGEGPPKGIYALVSLVSLVALFWYYFTHKHAGADLWGPTLPTRIIAAALMAVALLVFGAGLLSPPPSSASHRGSAAARGLTRITRHPVSATFFLLGLAHVLVLGKGSDLAFFGGWCIWTLLATRHQDARKSRQDAGYARMRRETSFIPFFAVLRGRQRLDRAFNELRWLGVLIGAVLYVLLAIFHGTFFGGSIF
jgi:uncharacterized membrane protein